jgi:hypothetical protein
MIDDATLLALVQQALAAFTSAQADRLRRLDLAHLLRTKNPYYYFAIGSDTPEKLAERLLDDFAASSGEAMFGTTFFEELALGIAGLVGGRKSAADGMDLELERDGSAFIVSIKSGPAWGNSSQHKALERAFADAKKRYNASPSARARNTLQPVLGICYGPRRDTDRQYRQLVGPAFWDWLSGEPDFHRRIVAALRLTDPGQAFAPVYEALLGDFTGQIRGLCFDADGGLDLARLVEINGAGRSRKAKAKRTPR